MFSIYIFSTSFHAHSQRHKCKEYLYSATCMLHPQQEMLIYPEHDRGSEDDVVPLTTCYYGRKHDNTVIVQSLLSLYTEGRVLL